MILMRAADITGGHSSRIHRHQAEMLGPRTEIPRNPRSRCPSEPGASPSNPDAGPADADRARDEAAGVAAAAN